MANYGFKASLPGFNTGTGTADKNLAFNSAYKHLMVRGKGKATSTSFNYAHSLGYKPTFDGYMLTSSKYFLNYFQTPFVGYQFENTLYGNIFSNATNLSVNCATANRLIYICYVNPFTSTSGAQTTTSQGDYGIKMSVAGDDVKTAADGVLGLTSKFQAPLIIDSGTITVNVDAIGPTTEGSPTAQKTNYTDYSHSQTQANHVMMGDDFGSGALVFYPGPIGVGPPYVVTDVEIYIDATKIRCRVSRYAEGFTPFPGTHWAASSVATSINFKFNLTNIPLPT